MSMRSRVVNALNTITEIEKRHADFHEAHRDFPKSVRQYNAQMGLDLVNLRNAVAAILAECDGPMRGSRSARSRRRR